MMLKKTTIYIEKNKLDVLKALSIVQNKPVAELIRMGVNKLCQSASKEEIKVMKMIAKIKQNTKKAGYSSSQMMNLAVKAQREIRSEYRKKSTRRS